MTQQLSIESLRSTTGLGTVCNLEQQDIPQIQQKVKVTVSDPLLEEAGGRVETALPFRLLRQLVVAWALLGGGLLLVLMSATTVSVLLDLFFNKPLPGNFELVQLACALAVFAFLPYCQMTRGHIAVDIFTMHASRPFQRAMEIISLFLMSVLGLLLLWRMWLGGWDYYDPSFAESTPILGIAIWQVFPPILFSLLLMTLVTFAMLAELVTGRNFGFGGRQFFRPGERP